MSAKGGSPGSSGTTTVNQVSQPPAAILNAYTNLTNQAQNLASQPYPGNYQGQLVAGFTPQQSQAMQTVQNVQGQFSPYLDTAAQAFTQATQPLWPSLPQFDTSGLPSAAISSIGNAQQYGAAAAQPIGQTVAPYAGLGASAAESIPGAVSPLTTMAAQAAQNTPYSVAPFAYGATQASASAPQNLSSFFSPYTQNVTDALTSLYNQQNAQQLAQVRGSAVGQGAYGGDREGVAEALTAQAQNLTQAPVLAQVQQQGFQAAQQQAAQQAALEAQTGLGAGQLTGQIGLGAGQLAGATGQQVAGALGTAGQLGLGAGQLMSGAMGTQGQLGLGAGQLSLASGQGLMQDFSQQQQAQLAAEQANAWLASQAGFGFGNLGQEQQSLGLSGASAELQSGGLQQQLAQEQLNIPYEQYIAQQAYPYQQLNFLAPIVEGTGSLSGGSSSTTSPGPSLVSQLGGLGVTGLAGAGLLNATGAFGPTGYLTGVGGLLGGAGGLTADSAEAAAAASGLTAADVAAGAGVSFPAAAGLGLIAKHGGRVGLQSGGDVGLGHPLGNIPQVPQVPTLSLDYIVAPGPATKGQGPPRAPSPGGTQQQPSDAQSILQDLQAYKGLKGLGALGDSGPSESMQRGGGLGGLGGLSFGGSHPHEGVHEPHLGLGHFGVSQPGAGYAASLGHMGVGGPHLRLQYGGQGGESPLAAAAPMQGVSPNVQTAYNQYTQMPLEQLQELSLRVPPSSAQGQMIQRALTAKRMTPGGGYGATATAGQSAALPSNFLPLQSPTVGGSGTSGGTAQAMAEGGDVVALKPDSPHVLYRGPMYRPDDYLGEPSALARHFQENPPANQRAEGGDAGPRNYVTEDEIDPHPVIDDSGDTIKIHYPSEGKTLDLGLPTSFRRRALQAGGSAGLGAKTTAPEQPPPPPSGMMVPGSLGLGAQGHMPAGSIPPLSTNPLTPVGNPFANISPVQMPNVGQATAPQPMTYRPLSVPPLNQSLYQGAVPAGSVPVAAAAAPAPTPAPAPAATPPPTPAPAAPAPAANTPGPTIEIPSISQQPGQPSPIPNTPGQTFTVAGGVSGGFSTNDIFQATGNGGYVDISTLGQQSDGGGGGSTAKRGGRVGLQEGGTSADLPPLSDADLAKVRARADIPSGGSAGADLPPVPKATSDIPPPSQGEAKLPAAAAAGDMTSDIFTGAKLPPSPVAPEARSGSWLDRPLAQVLSEQDWRSPQAILHERSMPPAAASTYQPAFGGTGPEPTPTIVPRGLDIASAGRVLPGLGASRPPTATTDTSPFDQAGAPSWQMQGLGSAASRPASPDVVASSSAPSSGAREIPTSFPGSTSTPGPWAGKLGDAADRYGVPRSLMLKTGQIESGLQPKIGAGWPNNNVLNLNERNWKDMGGGDVSDPDLQADHGAKYLAQMLKSAKQTLGRDPQDWETYLFHQQGEGGAPALLSHPEMNVVDALTPAYKGDRATAQKAVIGNAGDLSMTARDFINLQRQRFEGLGSRVNLGAPLPSGAGSGDQVIRPGSAPTGQGLGAGTGEPATAPSGRFGLGAGAPGAGTSHDWTQSPWFPLMAAGLGMMASRSPYALGAVGEGGLQGIKTAEDVANRSMREQQFANEAAYRNATLQQTGAFHSGELAQQGARLSAEQGHWADQMAAENRRYDIQDKRANTAEDRAQNLAEHQQRTDAIMAGYRAATMTKPLAGYERDPSTGATVYGTHAWDPESMTWKFTPGPTVGRPVAGGASTFDRKLAAAKAAGMNDQEALAYANGQRQMTEQQIGSAAANHAGAELKEVESDPLNPMHSQVTKMTPEQRDAWIKQRGTFWQGQIRTGFGSQASGAQPPAAAPAYETSPAAQASPTKPTDTAQWGVSKDGKRIFTNDGGKTFYNEDGTSFRS